MKSASALFKGGTVFIQSYAETTSGVWIAFGPVYKCPSADVEQLTRDIRSALAASTRGVPHPGGGDWKAIQQPMLDALGAKNWAALAKGAKAVGLECEDGIVTMTPSQDYEDDGGSSSDERAIKSSIDAENLGRMLVSVFDLSS